MSFHRVKGMSNSFVAKTAWICLRDSLIEFCL
jgi:hypothetical protein